MRRIIVSVLSVFLSISSSLAEDSTPLLSDLNGDGNVSLLAFGDSITYGVGDHHQPGEFLEELPPTTQTGGYPSRLSTLLSVPVKNSGVPGEELIAQGVFRAPFAADDPVDVITVMEGVNDAVKVQSRGDYARALQKTINVIVAQGKKPLLMTPIPPCCRHEALAAFTESYADAVRELAAVNDVPLSDTARAWTASCQNKVECELYNVPEGLHPNSRGYEVIAQTVAASLLGIDIHVDGGASELESALGLPAGSVIVRPDPVQ